MTKLAIVSSANSAYFPLLQGMILSLRRHERGRDAVVHVIDGGLEADQRHWLAANGAAVFDPGWDYVLSSVPGPYFKAMTARPHLPKHLPGHDVYLWLDADVWVQDWRAIDLYIEGALKTGLAITPELDRSYCAFYNNVPMIEWRYFFYRKVFGETIAQNLAPYPLLNSGAFAVRANAPHWASWANMTQIGFQKGADFFTEQTALNVIVWKDKLPVCMLPSWCNWISNFALPACDKSGETLFEPAIPHERIGIVHLNGHTKNGRHRLVCLDGGTVERSLRYNGPNGGAISQADVKLPL